jgi:hypothetical protein
MVKTAHVRPTILSLFVQTYLEVHGGNAEWSVVLTKGASKSWRRTLGDNFKRVSTLLKTINTLTGAQQHPQEPLTTHS